MISLDSIISVACLSHSTNASLLVSFIFFFFFFLCCIFSLFSFRISSFAFSISKHSFESSSIRSFLSDTTHCRSCFPITFLVSIFAFEQTSSFCTSMTTFDDDIIFACRCGFLSSWIFFIPVVVQVRWN